MSAYVTTFTPTSSSQRCMLCFAPFQRSGDITPPWGIPRITNHFRFFDPKVAKNVLLVRQLDSAVIITIGFMLLKSPQCQGLLPLYAFQHLINLQHNLSQWTFLCCIRWYVLSLTFATLANALKLGVSASVPCLIYTEASQYRVLPPTGDHRHLHYEVTWSHGPIINYFRYIW